MSVSDKACAYVHGNAGRIRVLYPYALLANKMQVLRFEFLQDAENLFAMERDGVTKRYATLEWYEEVIR
jgi:hypothetical protein